MPQRHTILNEANPMSQLQELMELWQHDLEELSPVTRLSYRRGVSRFLKWYAEQGPVDLASATVREWVSDLRDRGYKPGSVNTWLAGLRSMMAGHEQGYIPL